MSKARREFRVLMTAAAGLILCITTGCLATDDARVLQLLNERGFGRKYTGNANEVFYYGVGDSLQYSDEYNEDLSGNVTIRMDGTAMFPLIGETYIAGLTSREIASMLNLRLGHYYKFVNIQVSPSQITSKRIFIQLDTDRHYMREFQGDQTLYDVIMDVNYDSIDVDLDNVKVIRSDPVNPLVIYCDMDDMIYNGNSRDNILIKEDDIIYFTPSWVGYLKRFVKTLLSPVQPVAQLFLGVQQIDYSIETFGEDYAYNRGGRFNRYRSY